ncbi:unnamed protein product [Anisakis simplex]|uniref:Ovule protein n=1 Tax=Anisakis simplex TaxID=6269 RepID=A0A0M3KA24_ANISI|nr:unnamed protein product [Anisakis simplex]
MTVSIKSRTYKLSINYILLIERAITGVRVNGIGPLIASSPTTHHDPNLSGIQPIDIHQYSQSQALWSNIDNGTSNQIPVGQIRPILHSNASSITHHPSTMHPSYPQMMPPAYTDLSNDVINAYGLSSASNHHYNVNMDNELDFSPQINTSDLSSPSCSD